MVEYIVAIDVTRARFPADAYCSCRARSQGAVVMTLELQMGGVGEGGGGLLSQAAIAQLGERQTEDLKVPGSILGLGILCRATEQKDERLNPDTRNRTRDHLIAANVYSQMLYQLSYVRW